MSRQARHRHGGKQADDFDVAAALRSDDPAARGQRTLWFQREEHPRPGAVALRAAQGVDVSENGRAGVAGGLPGDGQADAGHVGRYQLRPLCQRDFEKRLGAPQQAHLQQRKNLRPFCDHPHARARKRLERAGAETLRPGHEALPRDLFSSGGISGDLAHHAGRGRAVQERRQGYGQRRLAGGLWQGSGVRRHAEPRAGQAGRNRQDRQDRSRGEHHQTPGALLRSDVAWCDGKRGQARRGRGIARRDERERSRHACDARDDHRRFDLGKICSPQRPRVAADGEGILDHHAPARAGHSATLLARTHGRVGVQAQPDVARQAQPRGVHEGNRGRDARHGGESQELRERHHPRRFRQAQRAVSEMRRRDS